jgi:hypothetical protein
VRAGLPAPVCPRQYGLGNHRGRWRRRTAWSHQHPAYEDLAGPSTKGLDKLFGPEINSQDTLDPGVQVGDDYMKSYTGVRTYDTLKVHAVLHWIAGYERTGKNKTGVPAIFGTNFQAVSVGQKAAVPTANPRR